jgi:hypothetical protein
MRLPSGEKLILVNLSGPANEGIDGHDPIRFEVLEAISARYRFVRVPFAVATASDRLSGE